MKLHQLVAISQGSKKSVQASLTNALHDLKKVELFNGFEKTYQSKEEEEAGKSVDVFPPESKKVQGNVNATIYTATTVLAKHIDRIVQQDEANTKAKGTLALNGKTFSVPVVTLIFLEKQLIDLLTIVSAIPTLDPAEDWEFSQAADLYQTAIYQTNKTKKVEEPIILYPHSDKHPAQTQMIKRDVVQGVWNNKKLSAAWPVARKNKVLARITELKEQVVAARELANEIGIDDNQIGGDFIQQIFQD